MRIKTSNDKTKKKWTYWICVLEKESKRCVQLNITKYTIIKWRYTHKYNMTTHTHKHTAKRRWCLAFYNIPQCGDLSIILSLLKTIVKAKPQTDANKKKKKIRNEMQWIKRNVINIDLGKNLKKPHRFKKLRY